MPSKTPKKAAAAAAPAGPVPLAAQFYGSDDMAAARGVTPATIRTYVWRASGRDWPAGAIPQPDSTRPLKWRTNRPEVVAWMTAVQPGADEG